MFEILRILDSELKRLRKGWEELLNAKDDSEKRWSELYEAVKRERDEARDKIKAMEIRVARAQEIMRAIADGIPADRIIGLTSDDAVQRNVRMFYNRAKSDWTNW